MTYDQTIEYLYSQLPVFQKLGKKAIKPKLTNIKLLCEALGNPQNDFKSIHIAGTNGKGSSSHFLASILQEAGFKVGLYTSPHLKDFRERFRINGELISKSYVVDFVEKNKQLIEEIEPSFFELTVALAFKVFSEEKVDYAVVEVGLGGRLDSTNIISPICSLITNIGFDHMDILGNTLQEIAKEKAGIIKPGIPVIISEYNAETAPVFNNKASECHSDIYFASESFNISNLKDSIDKLSFTITDNYSLDTFEVNSELVGFYQIANIIGVFQTCSVLNKIGVVISTKNMLDGIKKVVTNTNLKGRWQILNRNPLVICDTGHNEHALKITLKRLSEAKFDNLHLILGFVKDKDLKKVFDLFPSNAKYYFTTFDSFRAHNPSFLKDFGDKYGLISETYTNVNQALAHVRSISSQKDIIFVGGSTYLVSELNEL
ncbi:MAG: bifunctional folylpolyglutamate synthase/dihydrofolate synthase [Cytophagaceae bacterium]|nr:bifunctional folylpolyglutamate synthase/dihydrofolate synthase [Cytophagaceae bacterium]MBL0303940.1 bifunctional folylpolyglutamate synthase/dihydrofolate synthase [Cytophagaceae bacterium]MBL0326753.1 bifunctional folylpolyglutamate synthase/dihydrofolate synthase [Cytophagaceae bacterium]